MHALCVSFVGFVWDFSSGKPESEPTTFFKLKDLAKDLRDDDFNNSMMRLHGSQSHSHSSIFSKIWKIKHILWSDFLHWRKPNVDMPWIDSEGKIFNKIWNYFLLFKTFDHFQPWNMPLLIQFNSGEVLFHSDEAYITTNLSFPSFLLPPPLVSAPPFTPSTPSIDLLCLFRLVISSLAAAFSSLSYSFPSSEAFWRDASQCHFSQISLLETPWNFF